MAKSKDTQKNVKKEATKTAKEKKAEKREKKAKKGEYQLNFKFQSFYIMKEKKLYQS